METVVLSLMPIARNGPKGKTWEWMTEEPVETGEGRVTPGDSYSGGAAVIVGPYEWKQERLESVFLASKWCERG